MSTFKKLFKEKNWRHFEKGDCIIATSLFGVMNNDLVTSLKHVKLITKVNMKLLRYEIETITESGKVSFGFFYFKGGNYYVKVNKELRCYFKIMRL